MEPSDGRISFARDVDYCSGCFLAISRADWVQLGGFDPAYAPAYYEETDLCVRVWQLGKRVVYDPGIFLWHFEFGTSNHAEDVIALLQRNQKYFASKHRAFLSRCSAPSQLRIEAARLRHSRRPRILFIEDKIPDRMVGEGFPRSSKIASVLESIGGHLTVIGMHPSATLRDQWDRKGWSRSTEILPGVNHTNIDVFARERHQVYDFVWLSRTHNLVRLASWRQRNLEFFEGVRIILDTEAVASARIASQASLFGDEMDADQLLRDEFAGLELVDHVIAVNKLDEALIRKVAGERGLSPAFSVLGHALPQHDDLADFDAASGIVLPGSFGNLHGPNIDAVRWFDQAVRPLLSDRMKGLRFIIAGHRAKEFVDSAGLEGSYEVLSDLDDMSALFRGARLALASTRFAGGIPFKVHEAAGHGVPVVISKVLADQLGWSGDPRLAIAEGSTPEQFAELLERFYFNREAWTDCRDRQLERVRTECSEAAFERTIREIIGVKQVNGKPERVGPEKIRREPKRQPVLVKFG